MSEKIVKEALRYNTFQKDYNNLNKNISKIEKKYDLNLNVLKRNLSFIKDKIDDFDDRERKNTLNLIKVANMELGFMFEELEKRKNEISDVERFFRQGLQTKYFSLNEIIQLTPR